MGKRTMKRLWSLRSRLTRQRNIQGQTKGIVGVVAKAVVVMAISKQPGHLAGVTIGASRLVAKTLLPT